VIVWSTPVRRSLFRQPAILIALVWLGLVVLGVICAPLLTAISPLTVDPTRVLLPPGPGNSLGTDFLGRDIFARLLWGGRWTLQMSALALALTVAIGLPVGLAAGSLGGPADALLMRLVDGILAFPGFLLAMVVVAVLGTGPAQVAVAVGLAAAPPYARVTRSVALGVREQPYVEAARAVGCSLWRIAVRHILLNAAPSLIAFAATQLGWVLLSGAALNFLGLGLPPGTPEWGVMMADGRGYLRDAPWASVLPGLALTLTVLAANLVGDRLQETLRL
jgi:peptide/nickel transport system permease protein